jgi:hypothetical protein
MNTGVGLPIVDIHNRCLFPVLDCGIVCCGDLYANQAYWDRLVVLVKRVHYRAARKD